MTHRIIETPFADIALWDTGGTGPAVLLLHGNSSCKEIFRGQFDARLTNDPRLIAMDLPGHGGSSDARDPAATYTLAGYGAAALAVLAALNVSRAAVFGWSLGGHVALDMVSRFPGLRGVMISGTPPIANGGFAEGFRQSTHMGLAGAQAWSEADTEAYARATAGAGAPFEPFLLEAARRTHGVARETFFADALSGRADDQRRIAETAAVPLAVINGAEDEFINADYFGQVAWANLWDGRVHSLAGLGHAPFWQAPERFNPLFERFIIETAITTGTTA